MPYAERIVNSSLVACTWEQTSASGHGQRVVPDACVDLIWSGHRLTIAGPDTKARVVSLSAGARLVGVRLRPGAAGTVLGLPASELRDISADATEVLGGEVATALLESLVSAHDAPMTLLRAVESSAAAVPDPLVSAAVRMLARPRARVSDVAGAWASAHGSYSAASATRSDTGRRCSRACCASAACRRLRRRPS